MENPSSRPAGTIMNDTLVILIREAEADRYRRDGWTVEPMPVCHHSRYRQMIATKPVEGADAA